MKLDYILLALKNIINRKLRSYLTVIGIVIGVTSLVSLITLGQGLENGITEQFDKFGANVIWIGPKVIGGFGGPVGIAGLTESDAETVGRLSLVDFTASYLAESALVEYGREELRKDIFAVQTEAVRRMLENVDTRIVEGRYLERDDHGVALIGWRVHKDMFEKEVPLKASLLIDGRKFRVVGIKEELGNSQEDNQIMIPLADFQEMLGKHDSISAFSAVLQDGVDPLYAMDRISRELERKRDDENFQVTSPLQIKEQTGVILSVVQLVVAAIASLSLIVGGLGIMNTLYSSVLERTRDIGVMKAIGAKNEDILFLFLVESGFMGVVGGIGGITLGLLLSLSAGAIINLSGVTRISIHIDWALMLFGLLFAFVVGVASGALPALRAAKLKPVDALRYE